jgi:imidazolonepropionase-like amidohydrolase
MKAINVIDGSMVPLCIRAPIDAARRAYKFGGKIAFGADAAVFPHEDNAHEFELMLQADMPPMFILQTPTINAAALLKREQDLGSISPGKLADVIAVIGNPLEKISIMNRVSFVMKEGSVYKKDGKAVNLEDIDDPVRSNR